MSAAEHVKAYVAAHPSVQMALAQGIVNQSALARKIQDTHPDVSLNAVKMALSRLADDYTDTEVEDQRHTLLEAVQLEARTNVALVASPRELFLPHILKAETASGFIFLINTEDIRAFEGHNIRVQRKRALLTLSLPADTRAHESVLLLLLQPLLTAQTQISALVVAETDVHIILPETALADAMARLNAVLADE